jgi:hypothetical protein
MRKPITPLIHGIIDYALAGVQMLAPGMLGFNKKIIKTYLDLGSGFLAINALTDTPVGVRRVISMKDHQKADLAFLTTLGLLTFTKVIEKDKKALAFHLGMVGVSVAHYLLTDYDEPGLVTEPAVEEVPISGTNLAIDNDLLT